MHVWVVEWDKPGVGWTCCDWGMSIRITNTVRSLKSAQREAHTAGCDPSEFRLNRYTPATEK